MKVKTLKFAQKNKFLMEHAREHAEVIKGTKGDMSKINASRKHEEEFLTYEALGTNRVNLPNCGKNNLEVSSIIWLPIEN